MTKQWVKFEDHYLSRYFKAMRDKIIKEAKKSGKANDPMVMLAEAQGRFGVRTLAPNSSRS